MHWLPFWAWIMCDSMIDFYYDGLSGLQRTRSSMINTSEIHGPARCWTEYDPTIIGFIRAMLYQLRLSYWASTIPGVSEIGHETRIWATICYQSIRSVHYQIYITGRRSIRRYNQPMCVRVKCVAQFRFVREAAWVGTRSLLVSQCDIISDIESFTRPS